MLMEQMLIRAKADIDIAKDAKRRGYGLAFHLAIENAESTLRTMSSILDKEANKKHMEAEQYHKKEDVSNGKSDIPDRFHIAVVVNFVRKVVAVAKDLYYFMLGWYYVAEDCVIRILGKEPRL